MKDGKLTILAVGGHIGDMELTAGMALAKHALEGAHIVTLALTAGEKGAPAGRDIADYRKQKVQEAQTFAGMLKGEAIVFDYPDGELPDNDEVRFQVCDVIRKVKPDILITHFKSAMHKDHNNTHKIVNDARFYASLPGFLRENPPHFAGRFYYAENWEDAVDFKPYLFVDTTEGYELWKKAIAAHWFVTGSTSFPYMEYYDHLSRVRGIEARKGRAECFMIPPETYRVIREGL
ncbi:N-acetylglucosaminyl deacetylase, LmbE family [Anaerocolumna jejuensis DSM 15929]|uniref:N-acetylglucosaminyl deacetylase, LmbE family n=1 Tax=Anaerocolumna jejuensis DSM 15929 TaxID=1121322 RepID=A0A1M7ANI1_9FIRM|nr:PIG-L deacetylase family protein [Anaerocolumna jejuensis]SHL44304.1 N-acetylglucosaminyl deacetylase, LmbE family [Anaerocolumna jejuensis DSM 15929]